MQIIRRPAALVGINPILATLRVPQELVDHIIDYLRDDTQSLKRCSSICVSMIPRSSTYLLRSLRVDTTRLYHFLRLLQISERLSQYVTEFQILDDEIRLPKPSVVYNTVLRLPNLKTLSFIGPFRAFSSSTVLLPPGPRRTLATLRFQYLHVDLVESVLELFRSVEDLHITGRYIDGSLATPRIVGEVKNLHIRIDPQFFCATLKLFRPSCLKSIELDCGAGYPVRPHDIDQVLQIYGGRIEKLVLRLPAGGLTPLRSVMSLDTCARLRDFSLTLSPKHAWRNAQAILPCLPTQVRRIALSFRIDLYQITAKMVQEFKWDQLLTEIEHCDELERLDIGADSSSTHLSLQDAIAKALPASLRRITHFV